MNPARALSKVFQRDGNVIKKESNILIFGTIKRNKT